MLNAADAARGGVVAESGVTSSSAWGALTALSLSMLLSSMGTSIANVALPTLAGAFAASFPQVQWIVLAYLLTITTLTVSAGRLGDIAGRRRLLLAGLAVFTVASALCGMAPSLRLLVAARAAQGLGAAVMMALTIAFVGETVPKERTGSAMGLLGTMSAMGTALGPSLGGFLIAGFGWPVIFFSGVPLGVLAVVLAYRYLPVDCGVTTKERARFDGLGTVLLAAVLAAYALAMTIGHGHFGLMNATLLVAGLAAAGVFIVVETRVVSPLIRLGSLRDAQLGAGLATNAIVATVIMATFVVGPFYLSRALGLNEAIVGMVMSIGPVISAFTGVLAGRLVDRAGALPVVIVGLIEMAVGSLALTILPSMFGVAGYIAAIVVLTPGYQLFQAANNTAVMADVSKQERGVVSGMLGLSRNLGLITGASVMGAVFAVAARTANITTADPAAVAIGMRVTFAVAAALIIVAIGIRALAGRLSAAARESSPAS